MQFYWLQYVSILENKVFLADLPSKSFLPSFTGKRKFTGHLPVNRWSGKISQITTLFMMTALNNVPSLGAGRGEPPAVVGALVHHLVHQASVAHPRAARPCS